ncbi:Uncharacterized protein DBV15_00589 [Temnothorax longispinosus]|uniref:Uncharacterized protein n=1 Tax=Temnothorax longispinosus TaxID=300112 RepID=A0A4S2KY67_9HYME|nr:Uncharacterized protein DBV15_00589 [Temnothorax longispinosus]
MRFSLVVSLLSHVPTTKISDRWSRGSLERPEKLFGYDPVITNGAREIKGKENRRVKRERVVVAAAATAVRGEVGERTMRRDSGEVGERTMRRDSYACTHTAANTGETGPRNDFTGITPAKSGRYGAAKCDVAIRHSRGLRCPRLPGRPAACRFARALSSPHAQVLGSLARAAEPGNISWMQCHPIMDLPMLALA